MAHSLEKHVKMLTNERGQTLVMTAFSIVALLGIAGLAIDLGTWYVGSAEAQRAAEAGAHAGAGVFLAAGSTGGTTARTQAESFAEENAIRGQTVEVLPDDDIDVLGDSLKVRVRVQRSQARGNPLATFFARAIGIESVDIGATAAAQVWPAGSVRCPLPIMVPDRWSEGPGYNWPDETDKFGDEPDDFYVPWGDSQNGATGYSPATDWGVEIQIYAGDPQLAPQPSWWHPFAQTGGQGADLLRDGIVGCVEGFTDNSYSIGQRVNTEPGAQPGPVRQGFAELIDSDDLIWNASANGGRGCPTQPSSNDCVLSSPRIRPLPIYDPRNPPSLGRKPLTIANFVGVFVNRVVGGGNNARVTVNFMNYQGDVMGQAWSEDNSFLRVIRIVE